VAARRAPAAGGRPGVTVASWNLNVFTLGQRGHKAALLDPLDWDVGTASVLD